MMSILRGGGLRTEEVVSRQGLLGDLPSPSPIWGECACVESLWRRWDGHLHSRIIATAINIINTWW